LNNNEVDLHSDLHSVLHSVLCSGNEAKVDSFDSFDSFDSSYAHMSSACEWKISIERDSGIGVETQSRRSMARIGQDWRRLPAKLIQKTEPCRRDSVDSAICAWGTHMLMTFSNAHEVLPRSCDSPMFMRFFYTKFEREEIVKAYCVKTIETQGLRAMQNSVQPERWKKTELAIKLRDSQGGRRT